MPKYTFTFKKGDILVDFSTTDREVVERQFQIWVNAADEYAKLNPPKGSLRPATPKVKEEKTPEPQKQEEPEVFDKASNLLKTINDIQKGPDEVPEPVKQEPTTNFEDILEKKVENPTFEPNKSKDQVFLNLVKSKNTTDKFHYLMITAYYLSEFDKLERFSLKQINAKLMQNLSTVIDHGMLQEAINQNFIELVPDLTGVAEVGEYRLTHDGEEFFASKI